MKPGDLVVLVSLDTDFLRLDEDLVGLHGVIVEPVTLEDGHPINSWCDWWVLIDGELQPWAKENLRIVNPDDGGYDNTKENT